MYSNFEIKGVNEMIPVKLSVDSIPPHHLLRTGHYGEPVQLPLQYRRTASIAPHIDSKFDFLKLYTDKIEIPDPESDTIEISRY